MCQSPIYTPAFLKKRGSYLPHLFPPPQSGELSPPPISSPSRRGRIKEGVLLPITT